MPSITLPLSLLALVPFAWFGFGAVGHIPETAERMLVALIDYAALILTFTGGVHWGLAMLPDAIRPTVRCAAGAVPVILAWTGLVLAQLVSPSVALVALILGYLATILTEQRACALGLVPAHYVWLRWGVSAVALAMMVMVVVLRGIGQTVAF